MADFARLWGYYDAGTWMAAVRQQAVSAVVDYVNGVATVIDFSVSIVDGYTAARVYEEFGPSTTETETYVLFQCPEGETLSLRAMLASPGMTGAFQITGIDSSDGAPTMADFQDAWDLFWLTFYAEILEALGGAATTDITTEEIEAVTGKNRKATGIVTATNEVECLIFVEELVMCDFIGGEEETINTVDVAYSGPATTPMTLIDTSRIAEAITQLELFDADLSLNYGATVFSIRTKIITE